MAVEVVAGPIIEIADFLTMASIFALLALGLNVQWGHTGLFNAGVAAFFAIGAYVTAILITPPSPPLPGVYPGHLGGFSMPFVVAFVAAGVISGLIGLLIAVPTLRLRTDYLAIATLGLGEVIRLYLLNDEPVTGGSYGIYQIPKLFSGMGLTPGQVEVLTALVALLALSLAIVALEYLGRSPWARVLKSIREDEDAAEVLGKDTFGFKLQSFVLGCALMGLAGSLFTVFLAFIEPVTSFQPRTTFTVWAMLLLGGSGNNRGVVLGAYAFYFLEWITVRIGIQYSTTGPPWLIDRLAFFRLMAVGVILILLVLYRPQGLLPERARTVRRRAR